MTTGNKNIFNKIIVHHVVCVLLRSLRGLLQNVIHCVLISSHHFGTEIELDIHPPKSINKFL